MNTFSQLRDQLRGPVFPVPVPFTEAGDLDVTSLEQYVDMLASHRVPAIMATVGTSRFNLLSRDEMLRVNAVIAEVAKGRSMSIAAGPGPSSGSTRENIQFAQEAQKQGADAIIAVYPERWYSDEDAVQFFHDIADAVDIGLMVHAAPMRDGFGGVSAKRYMDAGLLEQIAQKDNLVGIKEENADRAVYEQILQQLNDKIPVIGAGGAMRRFVGDVKLGAYTYLVGVGSFRPDLALSFYDAAMAGDDAAAGDIAGAYEDDYFKLAVGLGWHRALKETLHLLHGFSPWERKPLSRLTKDDRDRLAKQLETMGVLGDAVELV